MRMTHSVLAAGAAILAVTLAAPSLADSPYSYGSPGYSRTTPPYSYQPPPYSYRSPSYSYEPPGYTYTPPGRYRRGYRANTPDYNRAYDRPESAYPRPSSEDSRRELLRDPAPNRFGIPRNPAGVPKTSLGHGVLGGP